jgi:hypothetical protein
MPTVPRYSIAQVSPSAIPGYRQSDNGANAADFGDNVAAGVANVGKELFQYAQVQQQKADAAKLMEADNQAWQVERDLFYDPTNGVFAKKGQDTFGVQDTVFPEYDKRISSVEAGLGNDRQRLQFREMVGRRRQSLEQATLRHVSTETDNFYKQQLSATVINAQDEAAANYNDPNRVQQVIGNVHGAIAAANPGEPDNVRSMQMADATSKVHSAVLDRLVTENPMSALTYYTDHVKDFTADDQIRAYNLVRPQVDDAAARATTNDILLRGEAAVSNSNGDKSAAASNPAIVQSDFRAMAADYGATITSMTRTQQRQAELVRSGATSTVNSQHVAGTAGDFVVPPDKADAFMADAKARGYQVVDERKSGGTGPHIHLELPPSTAQAAPPATRAEALALADNIADPNRRRDVRARINDHFEVVDAQRIESDRATLQSIYTKVYAAQGTGADLRKTLSPAEFNYAVAHNHVSALQNALTHGSSLTGDLSQQGEIDRNFFLAASGRGSAEDVAAARKFVAEFNPWDTTEWNLTDAQRRQYAGKIVGFKQHNQTMIADEKFTGNIVEDAMFNTFGYLEHKEGLDADAKYSQFRATLTNYIQAYKANNQGKQPSQEDVQRMADALVLPTADGQHVFESGPGSQVGAETPQPTQPVVIPPEVEQQIIQAFPNATPIQRSQLYLKAKLEGRL